MLSQSHVILRARKSIARRDFHFCAFVAVLLRDKSNFGSPDYLVCVVHAKTIIYLRVSESGGYLPRRLAALYCIHHYSCSSASVRQNIPMSQGVPDAKVLRKNTFQILATTCLAPEKMTTMFMS